MTIQAALYHARENRVERFAFSRYRSLISTPFNLGTVAAGGDLPNSFIVRSSIRFGLSHSAGVSSGQLRILTSRGRTISTPGLVANRIYKSEYLEKDLSLEISSDVAGNVSLYVVDSFGRSYVVASGVFT